MRRLAAAVVVCTLSVVHSARGNDVVASVEKTTVASSADARIAVEADATNAPSQALTPAPALTMPTSGGFPTGHLALSGLYAGFAALQAYDVYSTNKVISAGGREANPYMRALVGNPLVFIGLKAAMTGGAIYEAEHLWRSHNRVAAVGVMLASNGIMMAVAAHNAQVLNHVTVR
jgi:hypothetical protein